MEHWHADVPNEGPWPPGALAATDVHRDCNASFTWSKKKRSGVPQYRIFQTNYSNFIF